jgi:glycosyltransferase involved in cell wall biosynthesis
MTFAPRVAFGIPVYNHAHQLRRTLESILSQTCRDVGIIVVDDCSTDETPQILAEYAALDPRLQVTCNDQRLGYTRNAMKAYRLARERFPGIAYFAWGSDHDLWHREWLRLMIEALDAAPRAAMAWSWYHRISGEGDIVSSRRDMLGTGASDSVFDRVLYAASSLAAGSLVHGLMRVAALERTSGLRLVLVPDRLLITELATFGPFVEVPEFLWFRRYFALVSHDRQRRSSFPGQMAAFTYLPVPVQHFLVLTQVYALHRLAGGKFSRLDGLKLAFMYARQRYRSRREREEREQEREDLREAKLRREEASRRHAQELLDRRRERIAARERKLEEKRRRREAALSGRFSLRRSWRTLSKRIRRRLSLLPAKKGGRRA